MIKPIPARAMGVERPDAASIIAQQPDHQIGMAVPKGGSSCAKCEYFNEPMNCGQPQFQEWNGSNKIPASSADEYCCDFFEADDGDEHEERNAFP